MGHACAFTRFCPRLGSLLGSLKSQRPPSGCAVLATDMEAHAELVRDLGSTADQLGPRLAAWPAESRLLAMQVSPPCLPFGPTGRNLLQPVVVVYWVKTVYHFTCLCSLG